MAYTKKYTNQAHRLRKRGESIAAIAQKLQIPKSTVSFWCKDIALSPAQIRALEKKSLHAGHTALRKINEKKRLHRKRRDTEDVSIGACLVKNPTQRELFFLGLGLYWGEGYKKANSEFGFTNSDPKMIRTYIYWLDKTFSIKRDSLILRVGINAQHSHRENEVLTFWSSYTNIPVHQFTKTSFIQTTSKKVFVDDKNYYGTLRIKVRNGKRLKNQVLAAIEYIANLDS